MKNIVLVVILWTLSGVAQAQTSEEFGFPAERFTLSLDRQGVWGADSAQPTPHKAYGVNLWLGYNDNPVSVYSIANPTSRIGSFVETRIGGELSGYYSFLGRFQVGARLPFTASQSRDEVQPNLTSSVMLGSLSSAGIGDIAINAKASLFDSVQMINVALGVEATLPTGGSDGYFGHDQVTITPELLASFHLERLRFVLNLGWTILPEDKVQIATVQDEISLKVAGAFEINEKIEVGLSLQLATLTEDVFSDGATTYSEAVGGASYRFHKNFLGFLGVGAGLSNGIGSPDFRVLGGLRFDSGFVADSDGDGVTDDVDKCPEQAEDKDKIQDTDGCPESDADNDGVPDETDKAPLDPEDIDGYQDEDGVPDPGDDEDGDGITDAADKCPGEPEVLNGVKDEDGCPDTADKDGDGINDDKDKCPEQAEDADKIADDDGCPEEDADRDGAMDTADACPLKPGPLENRGCPDTDRDGDGVVDRMDNCPDEKGSQTNQGCAKKQDVRIAKGKIEILKKVYFSSGKSKIKRKSFNLLRQVARVLNNQPRIKRVSVEGHTDSRGNDAANERLSQNRAQAVVDFLVSEGVDPMRLNPKGFGEAQPIDSNRSRAGRANNRRVEFVITEQ